MQNLRWNNTAVAAAALLASAAARADLISHSVVGYGDVGLLVNEEYGTTHAAASLSYTSPGLFSGDSESHADYGRLSDSAHVNAVNASYPINRAQAESAFHDTLTISGPSGIGFILYEYTLTGAAAGDADAHMFLSHEGEPDEELAGEATGSGVYISQLRGITFGQPFRHGLVLSSAALIGLGETGESDAEFVAVLTGISVFDAQMAPVAGYSISSESGTQYPLPAPSTLSILAVVAVAGLKRRRPPIRGGLQSASGYADGHGVHP